jgi:hypothetical protein
VVGVEIAYDHVGPGPGIVEGRDLHEERSNDLARAGLVVNVAEIKKGGVAFGVEERDTDRDQIPAVTPDFLNDARGEAAVDVDDDAGSLGVGGGRRRGAAYQVGFGDDGCPPGMGDRVRKDGERFLKADDVENGGVGVVEDTVGDLR